MASNIGTYHFQLVIGATDFDLTKAAVEPVSACQMAWRPDGESLARHYVDRYGQDVHKLIEAKIHGRDIVAPEEKEEEPAVYNLMDALRKSMEHNRTTAHKNGNKSGGSGKSHPHGPARSRGSRRGHRRAS